MRPRRLELSGFTSFKEPTEIDFADADYFALVGPTGSGKSSVIDAICFVLYGCVPRYDREGLVAPVISHGKIEAKVLLDFSIDGKDYTAARVVRRSGKGASTKEARLESGGEVLAGNGKELTQEVARLVGLSFEHFTKCVVLPQGEFARLLHDDPGDRQALVVTLLNLGVYERMRQLANARSTENKRKLSNIEARLTDELSFATPNALKEANARAKQLGELRRMLKGAKPLLDAAGKRLEQARVRQVDAESAIKLVTSLEIPGEVEALVNRLTQANKAVVATSKAREQARERVKAAMNARKRLSQSPPLIAAMNAHEQMVKLGASVGKKRAELVEADKLLGSADEALTRFDGELRDAKAALQRIELQHQAQHLAQGLKKGEPCPVCLQAVDRLPKHPKARGLDAASKAREVLDVKRRSAAETRDERREDRAGVEKQMELLVQQRGEVAEKIKSHPERDVIVAALDEIEKAEVLMDLARTAEDQTQEKFDLARHALDDIKQEEIDARAEFETCRDQMAKLEPPPAIRKSLAEDWLALVSWGEQRAADLAREADAACMEAVASERERNNLLDDLLAACRNCELEVPRDEDPFEAVLEAQTRAEDDVKRIKTAINKAEELRKRVKTLELDRQTAHELSLDLSANPGRFESWLVNAALRHLVQGATGVLEQLSNQQYALTTDEKGNFLVIDHDNADERRSAKTLSGGETFLASLALALALADQLADLASEGAAKLEAIFLDEGFGSLDPGTLDTVAATVENLAAGGRMVGIVTHVRELADRVPLQFRVSKEGASRIDRVDA